MSQLFENQMTEFKADSLEQRVIDDIKMNRRGFFGGLSYYRMDMVGGSRYNALVEAGRKKDADEQAARSEQWMKEMCARCMLTIDGKTLDERVPVDDMLDQELKNLHESFMWFAYRHEQLIRRMLLSAPSFSPDVLSSFFSGMAIDYVNTVYERGHVVEEVIGVHLPNTHDLKAFLDRAADEFSKKYMASEVVDQAKRDECEKMATDLKSSLVAFFVKFVPKTFAEVKGQKSAQLLLADAMPVLH